MELTFGQLEGLVARVHGVHQERHAALRGRLQNFQRLHFPEGVRVGRGPKVRYDENQVMQLLIALEFSACRVAPAYTSRLVGRIWPAIRKEVLHLLAQAQRSELRRGAWLVAEPDGLSLLRDESRTEIDTIDEVYILDWEQLAMQLRGNDAHRFVVVDLARVLHSVSKFLEAPATFGGRTRLTP